MAIIIDSISFSNEFKPADTSWLLANIGEKINVTIDFTVRSDAIPDGGNRTIICNPPGNPSADYIQTFGFGGFDDFNVGDAIAIDDTFSGGVNSGPYTIIQKDSASIIRVNANMTNNVMNSANDSITLNTPMEAIRYNSNLIGNSENPTFNSKIDNSNQELTINNYPLTIN